MKKLSDLMSLWLNTANDVVLQGIQNDSRKVKPHDLFLAYPGHVADGRMFIQQALDAGAAAVLYESENWPEKCPVPDNTKCIPFNDLSKNLPDIARRFFDDPSQHMQITGITGTNGKTTIAYQLAQAHNNLHHNAVYIGTIGQGHPDKLTELANTTPDALILQKLLHDYHAQSRDYVCMEVSSHGLSENRVGGIRFKQAIFTNLSHEHLDYHPTMTEYAKAKALLFAQADLQTAIINRDDAYSQIMRNAVQKDTQILTYGIKEKADIQALKWQITLEGTNITVRSPWGKHQLNCKAVGYFNVYNALAVFSSLLASEYPPDLAVKTMQSLQPAPGRMEIVAQKPYVIVDYAHTPDALDNVLATLVPIKAARIITVFGCGGNRDKTKRPQMGKIAYKHSDITILTSDNPRHEDPDAILDDIAKGMESFDYRIANRREAIEQALSIAEENDIVVIAGKGHETYQQIGDTKHHFCDKEIVQEVLRK